MKSLVVESNFDEIDKLQFKYKNVDIPEIDENEEVLIKVKASGVNPSDALATIGYFDHAQIPRVPGRDFSGIIVKGSEKYLNKKVWGSGGTAGIGKDGTQSEYIKLRNCEVAELPSNIDILTAGGLALPYITAYYSLFKRGNLKKGESCLVVGALGQVGRSAMALCNWRGVNTIALVRSESDVIHAEQLGWKAIQSDDKFLSEKILELNNGQPVDGILNTIGTMIWPAYLNILADYGRIITIGAREGYRECTVNLFTLYRANQELIGVNTVTLDFEENSALLDEMKPGFESGHLASLIEDEMDLFPFEQGAEAYKAVMRPGNKKRVILTFSN